MRPSVERVLLNITHHRVALKLLCLISEPTFKPSAQSDGISAESITVSVNKRELIPLSSHKTSHTHSFVRDHENAPHLCQICHKNDFCQKQ